MSIAVTCDCLNVYLELCQESLLQLKSPTNDISFYFLHIFHFHLELLFMLLHYSPELFCKLLHLSPKLLVPLCCFCFVFLTLLLFLDYCFQPTFLPVHGGLLSVQTLIWARLIFFKLKFVDLTHMVCIYPFRLTTVLHPGWKHLQRLSGVPRLIGSNVISVRAELQFP
jgi:hypothetical protein